MLLKLHPQIGEKEEEEEKGKEEEEEEEEGKEEEEDKEDYELFKTPVTYFVYVCEVFFLFLCSVFSSNLTL